MMYLDLAELDHVFSGTRLWSTESATLAAFRRRDHLGDPRQPLDEAVRDEVESRGLSRPTGPIRLLTQLRNFGYVMNPVSFYYCFSDGGLHAETVVAEVNNTPWDEQHVYVLSRAEVGLEGSPSSIPKEFHVSPFLPMEMRYDWSLIEPGKRLRACIATWQSDEKILAVQLRLKRREITPRALRGLLLHYPVMTGQVVAAIYWQALRLWWKGAHFYPHPKKRRSAATAPDANKSAVSKRFPATTGK